MASTTLSACPGESYSFGYAINDSGQVAGVSWSSLDPPVAFLYSNGVTTNIGVGLVSVGYAISNIGQITGVAYPDFISLF